MTKFSSLGLFALFTSGLGLALSAAACGGDSGDRNPGAAGSGSGASGGSSGNTGGTSSTGGSSGTTGGTGGTGGSGGSTGGTGGTFEPACTILPVSAPLITDFTYQGTGAGGEGGGSGTGTPADPEGISFGYDADPPTIASGYSFRYPDSLTSDVTGDAWHVSGSVAAYSGLVINFVCGADASEYSGVSFKISGNAGESGSLKFFVAHAANSWYDEAATEPAASRCMSANQYSGECSESFKVVEVTEDEQTVTLTWEDFKGGKPEASPNPKEIMALRWVFDWDETKNANPEANAYDVDITIDDVTFTQ